MAFGTYIHSCHLQYRVQRLHLPQTVPLLPQAVMATSRLLLLTNPSLLQQFQQQAGLLHIWHTNWPLLLLTHQLQISMTLYLLSTVTWTELMSLAARSPRTPPQHQLQLQLQLQWMTMALQILPLQNPQLMTQCTRTRSRGQGVKL